MRRKYRGFRGQVAPLAPGLGWLPKEHATADANERFPDSLYFCGMEDYQRYVQQYGAVPAGSSILGTGMGMPQMCIDAGYAKEYVYTTGGNILQTKITGPGIGDEPPPPEPPPPPPPAPEVVAPTAPTAAIDPRIAEELAAREEAARARAQELETRQATEGGDGIVPELEARASVAEATRRAIEGGGYGPGAPAPGARPPIVPEVEDKPNWLPLIVGAVAIYLMQ